MSKHETFADYPPRSLAAAEAALLTIWPTLNRYHDDLVLVGGLAVHYLTKRDEGHWPGAVTMDVDFGISLATEGGQYGTVQSDLAGLGFKPEPGQSNRLVRQVEDIALYVDFLTEAPPATGGSRTWTASLPVCCLASTAPWSLDEWSKYLAATCMAVRRTVSSLLQTSGRCWFSS